MPNEWADGIIYCDLGDEPELSEDISALIDLLKCKPTDKVPHVVLNFGGVSYLNSSHIASLLRVRKRTTEGRRQLVLAAMNDDVWSVMLLTGLDKVFQFAPDMMTALARVQLGTSEESGGA